MEQYQNIARYDIEDKLTGDVLKINRIIASALLIGPLLFLLIVIFLYEQNSGGTPDTQSVELIEIMIMVLMILAVSIYSLVIMFPKIFLRKENLIKLLTSQELFQKNQGINDPAAHLIGVDRTLMIIRLAMTEGITLFGLVILLLSVQNGAIYTNDLYWLLSLPWLIQLFFTVNNYLSKEKAVERIYNEILPGVIT